MFFRDTFLHKTVSLVNSGYVYNRQLTAHFWALEVHNKKLFRQKHNTFSRGSSNSAVIFAFTLPSERILNDLGSNSPPTPHPPHPSKIVLSTKLINDNNLYDINKCNNFSWTNVGPSECWVKCVEYKPWKCTSYMY